MNKIYPALLLIFLLLSCSQSDKSEGDKIITVSIAPFKYFVDEISGGDFKVNVMVPAGADPHIYEPYPDQISKLRRSVAYISNGYLGFEMIWLKRFYETNPGMMKISLGDKIDLLDTSHDHSGDNVEVADPHYWVSPKCALNIASSVRVLLSDLNPQGRQKYEANYMILNAKIKEVDSLAQKLFGGIKNRSFMIFHPNLGYLARDYGLHEISVEIEGKEPSPSRMMDLIDIARKDDIKTIFVQKEFDTKNAKAIADEISAKVKIIDPLSVNWLKTTTDIINALHTSMIESSN